MTYTKEQLTALKALADKHGGFQNEEFKNLVNQKQGEGAYDKLVGKLKTMRNDIKQKSTAPFKAPVNEFTDPQSSDFVKPEQTTEGVNTTDKTIETPKIETPKTETPKTETPKIETPKIETPKIETPKIETPTEQKAPPTDPGSIPGVVPEEVKSELQINAENKGYAYTKNNKGEVLLQPKDLDQAIDMFIDFGGNVKLDKTSKEAITGTKIYETFSKYKNASSDVYVQGLKNNQIGVGGETWDRLVRINGGEPTAAMLEAQSIYEKDLKISNINGTKNIISGEEISGVEPQTEIEKLDNTYFNTISKMFGELADSWKTFKEGNEVLGELNSSLASTKDRIDELNLAKRKVLKDVQERYPKSPLSLQLSIAQDELELIDDQLFVEQRQYNMDFSAYQFEQNKAQAEYEYETNLINNKMKFAESIYGIQRGDAIRQEDIARQDLLIQQEREQAELNYQRALKDGNEKMAKEFAYELALAEAKTELSKEFKFTTPESGVVAVMNPNTGEVEFRRSSIEETGPTGTFGPTGTTGDINASGFSTPTGVQGLAAKNNNPGNVKMSPINKDLAIGQDSQGHLVFPDMQTGLQALINDVGAKLKGNTITGVGPNSTLSDLSKVYAEDNVNWLNNVSRVSGYSANTLLKDISLNKLIPAIVNAETSGTTEFILEETDNYTQLSAIDKLKADSYLSGLLRGGFDATKDLKVTDEIKAAANDLFKKVEIARTSNPELSGLFKLLSKGGSKLSDAEGANIGLAEIQFAKDGNIENFVSQIRGLANSKLAGDGIDINNITNKVDTYDRRAGFLEAMDSNKWEAFKKAINDKVGLTTTEEFDKFATINGLSTALFVKEISGAAVTDEEFLRLSGLLPNSGDTLELAKNKLAEFRRGDINKTLKPAIFNLFNKENEFYTLFPELQGAEVYIPQQDELDQYINNLSGSSSIISNEVNSYLDSLNIKN